MRVHPWLLAWPGGALIGVANGVARQATYDRVTSERTAHQISTLTAIAAFAAYFRFLQRRWPIAGEREAVALGVAWLLLTIAFEFGFGRRVAKMSWGQLLEDYDLARGRTWPLVLVWLAAGPAITRRQLRDSALTTESKPVEPPEEAARSR